jgi:hypothetical protein
MTRFPLEAFEQMNQCAAEGPKPKRVYIKIRILTLFTIILLGNGICFWFNLPWYPGADGESSSSKPFTLNYIKAYAPHQVGLYFKGTK